MLKVYTDAAVNGNPGNAGIGIVLTGNHTYHQLSIPLEGKWDNHTAEWEGMRLATNWLVENHITDSFILLYSDSQIVTRSIEKRYVKNKLFQPFLDECLKNLDYFPHFELHWIPEKQNKGADNLARQALQKALKQST